MPISGRRKVAACKRPPAFERTTRLGGRQFPSEQRSAPVSHPNENEERRPPQKESQTVPLGRSIPPADAYCAVQGSLRECSRPAPRAAAPVYVLPRKP